MKMTKKQFDTWLNNQLKDIEDDIERSLKVIEIMGLIHKGQIIIVDKQ